MLYSTGIGVGIVCNSSTIHGLMHPEAGHVQVSRFQDDVFKGLVSSVSDFF